MQKNVNEKKFTKTSKLKLSNGAGNEDRTRILAMARPHNSHYTIPASTKAHIFYQIIFEIASIFLNFFLKIFFELTRSFLNITFNNLL